MIKNLHKIGLVLIAGLSLGTLSASGQMLYEPFEGTGVMNGHNGWTNHSGTAGQLMRVEGGLSYAGLQASMGNKLALKSTDSEDVNKLFASPVTSGSLYGSLLLNVADVATLSANDTEGNYFAHFQSGVGNVPFVARVYIRMGSQPNTFNLGILNNSPVVAAPYTEMYGATPTNYATGQTVLVVFKYEVATNTSSIWVNPTLGGSEPSALVTQSGGDANTSLTGVAIRQSLSSGKNTGNIEIDELRVGTTFASVTPTTTTGVKEFASAGLALYPNPTSGSVKLQLPSSFASKRIGLTLYAVNGDVLLKSTGSEQALNEQLSSKLGSAAAGMYILRIDNGSESFQTRIVKN